MNNETGIRTVIHHGLKPALTGTGRLLQQLQHRVNKQRNKPRQNYYFSPAINTLVSMNTHSMLQIKFSVLNVLGIFRSFMQNDSTLEMFGVIYSTIVSKLVSI